MSGSGTGSGSGAGSVELRQVTKTFDAFTAVDHLDLSIESGEFLTFLGPSGCGKTTTLRMIAGFEQPTSGSIRIDGVEMAGVPPFKRNVNTVFQNYALFPHLSVRDNVAFGLKMKRVARGERAQRVNEALDQVQLTQFADRRPSQLSGGQQQRVALARALVNRPAVLLLDEPLGALDLKLRKAMQIELAGLQERVGITFIYVTHDQEEALTMSDRIAVMNEGRLLQVGSAAEVYNHPSSRFVASFIGESNFLTGTVESRGDRETHVRVPEVGVIRTLDRASAGDRVTLAIRPEKISLGAASRDAFGNQAEASVVSAIFRGRDVQVVARLRNGAEMLIDLPSQALMHAPPPAPGDTVTLSWEPAWTSLLLS